MKKVLLGLLVVVLVLGVLSAVSFAGYRYGFDQGALSASSGEMRSIAPRFSFGPQRMPMHNFGNGFDNEFGARGFNMMQHGRGFGFFTPFMFIARIAFWGLVIWAIHMLVMRSGWRLTKTQPAAETIPADSTVENKES